MRLCSHFKLASIISKLIHYRQNMVREFGSNRNSRVPKSNVYLKTGLVGAANAASRTRSAYLPGQVQSAQGRRGYKRATMAVARKGFLTAPIIGAHGPHHVGAPDTTQKTCRDNLADGMPDYFRLVHKTP